MALFSVFSFALLPSQLVYANHGDTITEKFDDRGEIYVTGGHVAGTCILPLPDSGRNYKGLCDRIGVTRNDGKPCTMQVKIEVISLAEGRVVIDEIGTPVAGAVCSDPQNYHRVGTVSLTASGSGPGAPGAGQQPTPSPSAPGAATCPPGYNSAGGKCTAPANAAGQCPEGGTPVGDGRQCEATPTNAGVNNTAGGTDATEQVQCTTESGLSWLICPAIDIALAGSAQVADIIDTLLEVPPLEIGGTSQPIFGVWSNLKNIGNIALIFVLFAIIFSQATSSGISAYGIKRIIPRLIAGAILINLSYFLCAMAIDIFNILGFGIRDVILSTLTVPQGNQANGVPPVQGDGGLLGSVVGLLGTGIAVAGVIAAVVIAIWLFGSLILLTLLIALVTLAARQALIVLMVIVSPLAIAAWILPNTERLFDKWKDLFIGLLAMFPLIMLLFSGSHVAATAMAASAGRNGTLEEGLILILVVLVALAPIAATPLLLKAGIFSMQRIAKLARATTGAVQKQYSATSFGQFRQANKDRDRRNIIAGDYTGRNRFKRARSAINSTLNQSPRFNQLTGGFGANRALANANQRRRDQADRIEEFGGDYELAQAFINSRGNRNTAAYQGLSPAQQTKFDKMIRDRREQQADTFIAAAQVMANSGVGDQSDYETAYQQIALLNPSSGQEEVYSLSESIRGTLRSKGRGDMVARTGDFADPTQPGLIMSTPAPGRPAVPLSQGFNTNWSEVKPQDISRHAVGITTDRTTGQTVFANPGRAQSLVNHLQRNSEYVRSTVMGLDSISDQRAKAGVIFALEQAMQTQTRPDGTAYTSGQVVEQLREDFRLNPGGGST